MLLVVALSALLLARAADDACTFTDTGKLYDLLSFTRCAESIRLDVGGVATPTLDTMDSLLDLFVFEEMAKEPIAPYDNPRYGVAGIDVREGMERVRKGVTSGGITADYAFHTAIAAVFLPLKDPHTVYRKPSGYGSFYLQMPVAVELHNNPQAASGVAPVLRGLSGSQKVFTDYFAEQLKKQGFDLSSFLEQRIVTINGMEPVEMLQNIADSVCYVSKNPNARLNRLVQSEFQRRSLRIFDIPTGFSNDPRTYEFVFEDGTNLTVPVFVAVNKAISGADQIIAENLAKKSQKSSDDFQTVENARTRMLEDTMPEDESASEPRTPLTARGKDGALYTLSLIHDGVDVKLHHLTSSNASRAAYVLSIASFAPEDPAVFTADFQKSIQLVQDEYAAHIKGTSAEQNFRLLVNVMGNGGGYITLGYRSLHALAPHVNPAYGNYSIRRNEFAAFFAQNGNFSTQQRYNLDTWEEFTTKEWYTSSTVEMEHPNGQKLPISNTYTFDLAYDEVIFQDSFLSLWDTPTPEFLQSGNEKLVFLTDGLCGSTCACFTKRAQEAHAGVFFGVGGNKEFYNNAEVPMDVSSFAGGSVMDTDFVFDVMHREEIAKQFGVNPFPTTALFRWAFEQIFSWKNEREVEPLRTLLEYVNNPVDDYVGLWLAPGASPTSAAAIMEIIIRAYDKAISKCYDFQIQPSQECEDLTPEGVNYTLGSKCVNGKFSQGVCTFMECDLGYVLKHDGSCVAQPEKKFIHHSNVQNAAYICLGVIAGVIVAGLVCFFGLKIFSYIKETRAAKKTAANDTGNAALIQSDDSTTDK